jgi:uncharacterized SAM-binding protein YcdF (DUF218 family)
MNLKGWLRRIIRAYFWCATFFIIIIALWTIVGIPLYFDRLCIKSELPIEAEYIVCIGAGLGAGNLPTNDGWDRIQTSVQLYLDGFAQKIIFTGGGSERISEAEVYSEAARWLGMSEEDALLEPESGQTSDHPVNIKKIRGATINPDTDLDIVTSELHSKRTALCFKKAGYSQFRLVTRYQATGRRTKMIVLQPKKSGELSATKEVVVSRPNSDQFLRNNRSSGLPSYRQSNKRYSDIFMRARERTWRFFTALRELAAMAAYKIKGYI